MKRLSLLLSVFIISAMLLMACSASATIKPRTLTVFAASSLTDAYTEIGKAFEATHPGVSVMFNFGGSSKARLWMYLRPPTPGKWTRLSLAK
jgi:molybdate transport system substrate-binding protein